VGVDIDTPWQHELAARVDGAIRGGDDRRCDLDDPIVFDQHVSANGLAGRDDCAVGDERAHV